MNQASNKSGFLSRLRATLNRGDSFLTRDIRELVPTRKAIDADTLEALEDVLLQADAGVAATQAISAGLSKRLSRHQLNDGAALLNALREEILEILSPCEQPLAIDRSASPFVILMVGVNGAGKTTTAAKLAARFRDEGLSVMLAAGDTFRAAAVEQLQRWGERENIPVIAQGDGADPAAVIYDAFQAARARRVDVLIADTAGRLHTQQNLMDELAKTRRVLARLDENAPQEVLLVLDASAGQNAIRQAKVFHAQLGVTGLVASKLDGTAKAGFLLALARELTLPVRYIGLGEKPEDLATFSASDFATALLTEETTDPA